MNGSTSNHYQKYTWLCVGATAVAPIGKRRGLLREGGEGSGPGPDPPKATRRCRASREKNLTEYYTPNAAASQENSGETPSREESYLVTVYDGKIGVFREGEDEPFLTADTEVYLLPREDVAILEKGIRAQGFGAVKSILEDYQ